MLGASASYIINANSVILSVLEFYFLFFKLTVLSHLNKLRTPRQIVPLFCCVSLPMLHCLFISLAESWPLLLPLCFHPTAHENRRGERTERSRQLHLNKEEAQANTHGMMVFYLQMKHTWSWRKPTTFILSAYSHVKHISALGFPLPPVMWGCCHERFPPDLADTC